MDQIEVNGTGPHEYAVTVTAGARVTRHIVRVPESLLDRLASNAAHEERLVRESFVFLLEREPPTSILGEFDLTVIARYFPEYEDVIRARLGT